jgi:hypothetical protein
MTFKKLIQIGINFRFFNRNELSGRLDDLSCLVILSIDVNQKVRDEGISTLWSLTLRCHSTPAFSNEQIDQYAGSQLEPAIASFQRVFPRVVRTFMLAFQTPTAQQIPSGTDVMLHQAGSIFDCYGLRSHLTQLSLQLVVPLLSALIRI